jgi:hypothetical protein
MTKGRRTLEWACAAARLRAEDEAMRTMLEGGEETDKETDGDDQLEDATSGSSLDMRWGCEDVGIVDPVHGDPDLMRAALALTSLGRR